MEIVIWGKAPGSEHESLLVSEHAGLASMQQARATVAILQSEHGCTAMRIQRLAPLGDAREVAAMFRGAVR